MWITTTHAWKGTWANSKARAGALPDSHPISAIIMSYRPSPIDTSAVSLDEGLQALTERLAEHAHDLWATQRLADGWSRGPARDDARKLHPCLVPYAELPDSEKEYDRVTAVGTLKAILALGYRIDRP